MYRMLTAKQVGDTFMVQSYETSSCQTLTLMVPRPPAEALAASTDPVVVAKALLRHVTLQQGMLVLPDAGGAAPASGAASLSGDRRSAGRRVLLVDAASGKTTRGPFMLMSVVHTTVSGTGCFHVSAFDPVAGAQLTLDVDTDTAQRVTSSPSMAEALSRLPGVLALSASNRALVLHHAEANVGAGAGAGAGVGAAAKPDASTFTSAGRRAAGRRVLRLDEASGTTSRGPFMLVSVYHTSVSGKGCFHVSAFDPAAGVNLTMGVSTADAQRAASSSSAAETLSRLPAAVAVSANSKQLVLLPPQA